MGMGMIPETQMTRDISEMSRVMVFVASEGFEPPNAEQSDLQSDPFGRLGNSPVHSAKRKRAG
ncbi:hypothetical protein PSCLAVI8L_160025 [Pseudoclavibacter sp. 8L]|nr:hypothetical protein PSCLAVI8L_160025 [Pseudoclavibacter sp. 8L]